MRLISVLKGPLRKAIRILWLIHIIQTSNHLPKPKIKIIPMKINNPQYKWNKKHAKGSFKEFRILIDKLFQIHWMHLLLKIDLSKETIPIWIQLSQQITKAPSFSKDPSWQRDSTISTKNNFKIIKINSWNPIKKNKNKIINNQIK